MKKKIVMMLFMLVVVCSTGACGSRGSTPTAEESINQEEFKEIKWPTSEIVQKSARATFLMSISKSLLIWT